MSFRYDFEGDENKLKFVIWLLRYLFTFLALVLGIKAPGIRSRQEINHEILDNNVEAPTEPTSSQTTQGSKNRNLIKIVKTILPFIWPKKSIALQIKIIICFLLMICSRCMNLLVPIYAKKVVDELTNQVFCWDLILLLIGLKFLRGSGGLHLLRRYLWIDVDLYTEREGKIALFSHVQQLSLRWHLSRKFGEVLQVMSRGVWSMDSLLNYFVFTFIPMVADIFIAASYLFAVFNAWFALIILVMITLYFGLTMTSVFCEV